MLTATTVSKETAVSSITTEYTGNHELTVWANISMTIEHPMFQYSGDVTLDHSRLDRDEMRAIRDLLNSPEVAALLDEKTS